MRQQQHHRHHHHQQQRQRMLLLQQATLLPAAFLVCGGHAAAVADADVVEQQQADAADEQRRTVVIPTSDNIIHHNSTPPPPPPPSISDAYHHYNYHCINHHDLPMEPDVGCSTDKPLCVLLVNDGVNNNNNNNNEATAQNNDSSSFLTSNHHSFQRPLPEQAGHTCISYPCHATTTDATSFTTTAATATTSTTTNQQQKMDAGCTADKPICVDDLQQRPKRLGQPGIQCVSAILNDNDNNRPEDKVIQLSKTASRAATPSTPAWGMSHGESSGDSSHAQGPSLWGMTTLSLVNNNNDHDGNQNFSLAATAACSSSTQAGTFSFCKTCPFVSLTGTTSCSLNSSKAFSLEW